MMFNLFFVNMVVAGLHTYAGVLNWTVPIASLAVRDHRPPASHRPQGRPTTVGFLGQRADQENGHAATG